MNHWQARLLCIVGAAVALVSCSGDSSSGRRGDAGTDDANGSFRCGVDAGGEPPLSQVALDGGVGIEQYVRAMSIARCSYLSRCFGLAAYVANECVDSFAGALGTWTYWDCPSKTTCGGTIVSDSSTALVQAVRAGTLQYDSQRARQCIAALMAEGCADGELTEAISECVGVFTCAAGADAGAAGADAGAADAGAACAGLLPDWTPLQTCASAADCAVAVDPGRALLLGPYCVAGFCSNSPCELTDGANGTAGYCTAFAQLGQPCSNNASSVLGSALDKPTETCAPGLACAGAADGGAGTCVTPQDVGSACTSTAACKRGLVCACGVCQIPPSIGPCADGLCKVGVAYCDFDSNACKPLLRQGDRCQQLDSCTPGLTCPAASTCQ